MTEVFQQPCILYGTEACPVFTAEVTAKVDNVLRSDPEAVLFRREVRRNAMEQVGNTCSEQANQLPVDTDPSFCPIAGEVVLVQRGEEV